MSVETIKVGTRLVPEERETHIGYDSIGKMWIIDSTVPKHFRKALKQGWTPIRQYIYEDGIVCGMILTAPERAITIRNVNKKELTEKQLDILNSLDEE